MKPINTVLQGDILDVLPKIPKNTFDFSVTSPPYNLGMNYGEGIDDDIDWGRYYTWCRLWMMEVYRTLKPNRRFCLNHYLSCGDKRGRTAPLMVLNQIALDIGFKHHGVAVWQEPTVSRLTAWGSWLKASSPYINSPYEGILILYKGEWKREDKGISTITKEDFIEAASGVWKMASERRVDHPAPYPVRLPQLCIDLLTYKGDFILDPFVGSGTTIIAAMKTKRYCLGIEQSSKYITDIKRRVQHWKATGEEAMGKPKKSRKPVDKK